MRVSATGSRKGHKSTCVIPRHYTYVKKRIPIPEGQLAIDFTPATPVASTKKCSKCGCVNEFSKNQTWCKACNKAYYYANRDRVSAYAIAYRKDPHACKEAINLERESRRNAPKASKACSKCGVVKEPDEFYKKGASCKACHANYAKTRYADPVIRERMKAANEKSLKKRDRAVYNEKRKEYRKLPHVIAKEAEYAQQYRVSHSAHMQAYRKSYYYEQGGYEKITEWRKSNPERVAKIKREARLRNIDAFKERDRRRRKRDPLATKIRDARLNSLRRAAGELHRNDIHYVMDHWQSKCAYCGHECHGTHQQLEHILPIVSGGTNALSNLTIACKHCNSSKSDKEVFTWWKNSGNWDPKREAKLRAHMESAVSHTDKDEFEV